MIADGAVIPHHVYQIMNAVKFGEAFLKKSKNGTIWGDITPVQRLP
jgi:hypothetical protein